MSSATDFLLYASPGDKGIEPFLDLIQAEARFEARPLRGDTNNFNGPNGFMGAVYAFGADYFTSDVQALLDSVQWSRPQAVAVLTRHEDIGGYAAPAAVSIFQPKCTTHQDGWHTWVTQP